MDHVHLECEWSRCGVLTHSDAQLAQFTLVSDRPQFTLEKRQRHGCQMPIDLTLILLVLLLKLVRINHLIPLHCKQQLLPSTEECIQYSHFRVNCPFKSYGLVCLTLSPGSPTGPCSPSGPGGPCSYTKARKSQEHENDTRVLIYQTQNSKTKLN